MNSKGQMSLFIFPIVFIICICSLLYLGFLQISSMNDYQELIDSDIHNCNYQGLFYDDSRTEGYSHCFYVDHKGNKIDKYLPRY